jgi:hypothetical protein
MPETRKNGDIQEKILNGQASEAFSSILQQ